jgi:aryl-alcohol dehydrogenase-like predicted oxidoreductase
LGRRSANESRQCRITIAHAADCECDLPAPRNESPDPAFNGDHGRGLEDSQVVLRRAIEAGTNFRRTPAITTRPARVEEIACTLVAEHGNRVELEIATRSETRWTRLQCARYSRKHIIGAPEASLRRLLRTDHMAAFAAGRGLQPAQFALAWVIAIRDLRNQ